MRTFLLRSILFFGILFLLAWSADIWITRQFKKLDSSPFGNWNDIYSSSIQSDILILGSSRAYVQFNPRILDSVLHVNSYNLGMNGRAVESQVIKYHTYRRKHNTKPKLILFEIYQGTLDTSNGFDRLQFVPYLKDPMLWNDIRKVDEFSWADCFIPCWRYSHYKKDVADIIKGKSVYCDPKYTLYKGFCDFDKPWNGSKLAKIDTLQYSRIPSAINELKQFLKECQEDSIQVVFVIAPYYIGATRKIDDIDGMYNLFYSITEPYQVPIMDYTNNPLSCDTAYFYNNSHLNRKGATLFSLKLAHDLDSLHLIPGEGNYTVPKYVRKYDL